MTATLRVLKYLIENGHTVRTPVHGLKLMDVIYSKEIIEKWNHARRHKVIIETMTYSFLGKLRAKGLVDCGYGNIKNYCFYTGHYVTTDGIKYYNERKN